MRSLLLCIVVAFAPVVARAQAPPYQRMRGGADDWQARGGHAQHWRGPNGGYGGFYSPYFTTPPIIAGSYYERPYPYHFDYYRNRWGAPPAYQGVDGGYGVTDCPCASPPPVELVE